MQWTVCARPWKRLDDDLTTIVSKVFDGAKEQIWHWMKSFKVLPSCIAADSALMRQS